MRRHDRSGCALDRDSGGGLGTLCAMLSQRLQTSVIGSVPQCRIFFSTMFTSTLHFCSCEHPDIVFCFFLSFCFVYNPTTTHYEVTVQYKVDLIKKQRNAHAKQTR